MKARQCIALAITRLRPCCAIEQAAFPDITGTACKRQIQSARRMWREFDLRCDSIGQLVALWRFIRWPICCDADLPPDGLSSMVRRESVGSRDSGSCHSATTLRRIRRVIAQSCQGLTRARFDGAAAGRSRQHERWQLFGTLGLCFVWVGDLHGIRMQAGVGARRFRISVSSPWS